MHIQYNDKLNAFYIEYSLLYSFKYAFIFILFIIFINFFNLLTCLVSNIHLFKLKN